MDVVTLIGIVMGVTELIKKSFTKLFKITINGKAAVILAVIVSIGVVVVKAVQLDVTIGLALIPTLIQVILGATIGYSIATKKST